MEAEDAELNAELNKLAEDYVRAKQKVIENLKDIKNEINDFIDTLEISDKPPLEHQQSFMLAIIEALSGILGSVVCIKRMKRNIEKITTMVQDLNDDES